MEKVDLLIYLKSLQLILNSSSSLSGDTYKFIVNGTSVQISGHAKNINIDKDSMEINF